MGSGHPVLVVDDDEGCRALIVSLLQQRIGCTVYEASSGDEALEVAELVRPALVVLDVNLPRVTGYEVCHELRASFGERRSRSCSCPASAPRRSTGSAAC